MDQEQFRSMMRKRRSEWAGITGDTNIPSWHELTAIQREAIEDFGYGPLSYPDFVKSYKHWYSHENANYDFYAYLERSAEDDHWGGHGHYHIEDDYEQRQHLDRLEAVAEAARAVVDGGLGTMSRLEDALAALE